MSYTTDPLRAIIISSSSNSSSSNTSSKENSSKKNSSKKNTSKDNSSNNNSLNNLTLEEFNTLLEENKPYTTSFYNSLTPSPIITLENTSLDYLIDLKILVCSRHKIYLPNKLDNILKHFRVSLLLKALYN